MIYQINHNLVREIKSNLNFQLQDQDLPIDLHHLLEKV